MNILQIIPILDPSNLWTGPHRLVFDISKRLAKRHKVTVCTSDMLNTRTRITDNSLDGLNGFEIVRVRNYSQHLSNATGLLITSDLSRFLAQRIQDYDLVHVHEYTTYQNIIVHHFAKKYGIPYILQAHGSLQKIGKPARKWLYDSFFGHRILEDASKVIALCAMEAEQYRSVGVPKEKVAVVPNGIDLAQYSSLPPKGSFKRKFGVDEKEKMVLYLGRIHKIKGIDILVAAFANIARELAGVKLAIVGPDDGYLSELEVLIESLKLADRVLITGPLFGENKLEAYVDSDIYVLPSRYETFPISLLEAYACGKPVIASMVGGLRELVVDGATGLRVRVEDVKQLEVSVLSLLNDACRAREMGLEGSIFVQNFTIEETVDKLGVLYKSATLGCS